MDVLDDAMTEDMKDSMLEMLKDWEVATGPTLSVEQIDDEPERYPVSETILLSGTGGDQVDSEYGLLARVSGPNRDSVNWAKRTVYKDSKHRVFKDEWAQAFRFITSHPDYVSLQIRAAEYLHERAFGYRERVNWTQKRAYLFLFDIAVQNGSLRDKHFNKFEKWLAKNPNATEEAQMLEMLEIRVVDSNPKWQNDVRKRKTAVIKGQGFVHGEDRNLPLEYCYDPLTTYPNSRP
ncbi:MAG: hypothetical protein HRT44_10205 [Bdellovibrionales bacterium]|nr:hypothetical protein [Bdellovibrionales bacterium]